ncbi:N-6 DNA methylase [Candidatus Woesearchaeota archaeon]|nr:N-6 DNA methylase [Candidatus Woesearchaeota archaeon]
MSNNDHGLGFEQKLWLAADKMRNNMDAAEYKHVVLGLIFLKYISDSFITVYNQLKSDPEQLADPEDKDEYQAERIFYVPKQARWQYLQDNAKQPEIGRIIDDAMDIIEKENPSLKGVLPKDYARPALDKRRLGELIDLIGTIGLGDEESKKKDILGRVYEYFLGQFADAEGKKGGQFYTPRCIVQVLVEMIEPYKGRVYDPCCGSSGMFVQSERFIAEHHGKIDDLSIYGQESNPTTWKLSRMNLAIRGIEANIALGDTFHNDQHKDLKADFILANPPFNISDWGGEHLRDDVRWKYGVPPVGNANFAWMQHMIHHLAPKGVLGLVLSNGSVKSNTGGEGEIRKNIVEADLVDCMIVLPSQLFFNTQIPACLWFIRRGKKESGVRSGEVLFIDARKMGTMISRKNRELTEQDVKKISEIYHKWRAGKGYEDVPGFCKSANIEDIRKKKYFLIPGLYVGVPYVEVEKQVFSTFLEEMSSGLKVKNDLRKKIGKMISQQFSEYGYSLTEEEILNANSLELEMFARKLFGSWFVDFNFPDDRNKPYADSDGKFSEKFNRKYPSAWKIFEEIKDVCESVNYGYTQSSTEEEIGPKFLRVTDINKQDWIVWRTVPFCEIEDDKIEKYLLKKGDIVVARMADPGKVAIFEDEIQAVFASYLIRIRPANPELGYYLYYFMKSKIYQQYIMGAELGSVQKNLNAKGLTSGLPIVVPEDRVLKKFNKMVVGIRQLMMINNFEIDDMPIPEEE